MFQLLLGALSGPTPNFAQLLLGFDVEDGPEGARVFHRRFLTVAPHSKSADCRGYFECLALEQQIMQPCDGTRSCTDCRLCMGCSPGRPADPDFGRPKPPSLPACRRCIRARQPAPGVYLPDRGADRICVAAAADAATAAARGETCTADRHRHSQLEIRVQPNQACTRTLTLRRCCVLNSGRVRGVG